jgi:cytochrome c553
LGIALSFAAVTGVLAVSPAVADENPRGRKLFQYCTQCHGDAGEGNPLSLAPGIGGLPAWYVESQLKKFRTGARGAHPDDVAGLRMRPMSRIIPSDQDVTAVAAHVASLPTPSQPRTVQGDPVRGQALYTPCAACHGADASGNPALFGPPLKHENDWYLLTQLHKFKAGIRGTNPADTTGALMRPMAMTLTDEQAMKDVVAYIMTLAEKR